MGRPSVLNIKAELVDERFTILVGGKVINRILSFWWSFYSIRRLECVIQGRSTAYLPLAEEGVLAVVVIG